ncbi:hypothetical protein THAOC_18917 [Thalassiosira oceanica]|uniref:Uncharacterized protein n=1 Tax=Thalassiosira oceanica TaxID=159749 RepID=K0S651_THAOC|nr:hypothetical protein THAOC_18917 [Thalassiosira oceanica]|eukprot:EJK60685.1 hypothetical protein THAOC_18917 [Thalassiosira oceanica]
MGDSPGVCPARSLEAIANSKKVQRAIHSQVITRVNIPHEVTEAAPAAPRHRVGRAGRSRTATTPRWRPPPVLAKSSKGDVPAEELAAIRAAVGGTADGEPEATVTVDLSVNGRLILDGEELHPLAAVVVYNLDKALVGSTLIAGITEEELRGLELESLGEALTELGVDPDHVLGGAGENVRLDGIFELVVEKLTAKLEARRVATRQAGATTADGTADGTEYCSFCPGGLPDPDLLLPGKNAPTCAQARDFATGLEIPKDQAQCTSVQVAESTCCPDGAVVKTEAPPAVEEEEEEEPPATAATAATAATVVTQSYECPFCAGGMSDPDATLEKVGRPEETCLEAKRFASVLLTSDDECSRVRQGMAVCCPDELAEDMAEEEEEKKDDEPEPATTTTTTTVTTTTTTTAAPKPEECVCSPRKYTFRLSLTQLCDVDDLDGSPGIGLTLCVLHTHQERSLGDRTLPEKDYAFRTKEDERALPGYMRVSSHQLHKMSVIDVQFLEFGDRGDLTVINQDDTYSDVDLRNGDTLTFDSISSNLLGGASLGEQSEYVPGGVQIFIRGRVVDGKSRQDGGGGGSRIVNQRVTWSYTNGCDAVPVNDGDRIGWVTFKDLKPASTDFCPVADTPNPTDAPVSASPTSAAPVTSAPTVTTSPSLSPTVTSSPSAITDAKASKAKSLKVKSSKSKSLKSSDGSMSMSSPTLGKSAKSKSGKAVGHHGDDGGLMSAPHLGVHQSLSYHGKSAKGAKHVKPNSLKYSHSMSAAYETTVDVYAKVIKTTKSHSVKSKQAKVVVEMPDAKASKALHAYALKSLSVSKSAKHVEAKSANDADAVVCRPAAPAPSAALPEVPRPHVPPPTPPPSSPVATTSAPPPPPPRDN